MITRKPNSSEQIVESKKKIVDRGIEGRTDRAEDAIRLVGRCFTKENGGKSVTSMRRLEAAIERLRRKYNSIYRSE